MGFGVENNEREPYKFESFKDKYVYVVLPTAVNCYGLLKSLNYTHDSMVLNPHIDDVSTDPCSPLIKLVDSDLEISLSGVIKILPVSKERLEKVLIPHFNKQAAADQPNSVYIKPEESKITEHRLFGGLEIHWE